MWPRGVERGVVTYGNLSGYATALSLYRSFITGNALNWNWREETTRTTKPERRDAKQRPCAGGGAVHV